MSEAFVASRRLWAPNHPLATPPLPGLFKHFTSPSITSPDELEPHLGSADWRDVAGTLTLRMWGGQARIMHGTCEASPDDCLRAAEGSGFEYVGVKSLIKTVRSGVHTALAKGTVTMLDQGVDDDRRDVYRVRIARSDIAYAFRSDVTGVAANRDKPVPTASTDPEARIKTLIEQTLHPYKHPDELIRSITPKGFLSFL